jgi:fructose-bisphosphate aldolase class II
LKQYNLETITAVVRAAEKKRSPAQILLFPWALHYSPLLIHLAAAACSTATVPIVLHMDHAQSEEEIIAASEYPFDSIMVDMSHYEKEENLEKTERITRMLHEKGIATEAEPGRINGGEDGVKDTGDLEGLLTTAEEAVQFVDTGIDFLAPAFGNVHGNYGGIENIRLDYER